MYLMDDPLAVSMERSWDELAAVVCDMPGERLVYVVGACNRGKTTFCRSLSRRLSSTARVAYIDCDPGQSSIGPPTTIGMQGMTGPGEPGGAVLRYFIGSTSPRGHLLPCLSGTAKLVEKARRLGFEVLVLDSSGFVLTDAAREFQFHVIDLLQPDFLVAFQHGSELESLLAGFDGHPGISIRHMPVSPKVRARDMIQRREYRRMMFNTYFKEARSQKVSMKGRGVHGAVPAPGRHDAKEGLLAAACDREGFVLSLGMVEFHDPRRRMLSLLAPPFDQEAAVSIRFGSIPPERR
jgi:polynucleotide 5'-hydroxyl-kinase GRC3/NOL9